MSIFHLTNPNEQVRRDIYVNNIYGNGEISIDGDFEAKTVSVEEGILNRGDWASSNTANAIGSTDGPDGINQFINLTQVDGQSYPRCATITFPKIRKDFIDEDGNNAYMCNYKGQIVVQPTIGNTQKSLVFNNFLENIPLQGDWKVYSMRFKAYDYGPNAPLTTGEVVKTYTGYIGSINNNSIVVGFSQINVVTADYWNIEYDFTIGKEGLIE
jgi:hypothetical protein